MNSPPSTPIVLDASVLISLSQMCGLGVISYLSRLRGIPFIIPPGVRHEAVSHPLHVRRFALSALRINRLIDHHHVRVEATSNLSRTTRSILSVANRLFSVGGKPLRLVDEGEAECLALLMGMKGGALAIDEKTTRVLIERPLSLVQTIRGEYAQSVSVNEQGLRGWQRMLPPITVLRSTELIAVAADHGYFSDYGPLERQALSASLYAVRNAGCSITEKELDEYSEIEA